MTSQRIVLRVWIWSAVYVAHFWVLNRAWTDLIAAVARHGPPWATDAVAYGLAFPDYLLGWSGVPLTLSAPHRALVSALWTVTAAAAFEGARWLWAIRPGRRRPFRPRESGPARPESSCPPPQGAV